jgi:hypothetical protein
MNQEKNNVEAVKQLIGEHLPHDVVEANARRIVACLKAVDGEETKDIEAFGVSLHGIKKTIEKCVRATTVNLVSYFDGQPITQWMPISQAPKDAVILLGYEAHPRMDRLVYEGCWSATQETWTSVNGFILHSDATHWQPMPRAPQPAHNGGE